MSSLTHSTTIPRIAHSWQPRPFPLTVLKFIDACNKPGCTAKELGQIVTADPLLAANILKLANSSAMGCGQKIKSIDHAIVLLGMKSLKQFSLLHGSTKLFQEGTPEVKQARQQIYLHTLGVACWVKHLSKLVPDQNADEMFLIGMLHDIGKLMYLDHVPVHYAKILAAQLENKLPTLERHIFGLDHAELGARCLADWHLPETWCEVVRFHHEPGTQQLEPGSQVKIQLIACANYLSWYQNQIDVTADEFQLYLSREFNLIQQHLVQGNFTGIERQVQEEMLELQSLSKS